MEIITETLSEAHEAAFDEILKCHKEIYIQTHADKEEFTLEYEGPNGSDDFITMRVLHPLKEPQVSAGSPYGPGFTEAYKKQFLTLTPPRADGKQAVYTYWNRSDDFPFIGAKFGDLGKVVGIEKCGDGRGDGYAQVSVLIKKLAADKNSRRGVIVTWNPLMDAESSEPPCMDMIQFVIRNFRVHMRIIFRSQDMLLGLPENFVGCVAFLEYVVDGINQISDEKVEAGELTIVSLIPHIYKRRDGKEFDQMRTHIFGQKFLGKWKPVIK
jgi:thymidylate synthase (methanogen type)